MGTTWPLPPKLIERYLSISEKILVVEEVMPFLEDNIKTLATDLAQEPHVHLQVGSRRLFARMLVFPPGARLTTRVKMA